MTAGATITTRVRVITVIGMALGTYANIPLLVMTEIYVRAIRVRPAAALTPRSLVMIAIPVPIATATHLREIAFMIQLTVTIAMHAAATIARREPVSIHGRPVMITTVVRAIPVTPVPDSVSSRK